MTTPMEDLLASLEVAKAQIKELPCFICGEPSFQPLIVITENVMEGAPEGGSRAIIVGVCETDWDEHYHNLVGKAKELMVCFEFV